MADVYENAYNNSNGANYLAPSRTPNQNFYTIYPELNNGVATQSYPNVGAYAPNRLPVIAQPTSVPIRGATIPVVIPPIGSKNKANRGVSAAKKKVFVCLISTAVVLIVLAAVAAGITITLTSKNLFFLFFLSRQFR